MRSEQAFKNMIANLFLQVMVFLSGIVLPRFILEAYGSTVNGMITSVTQFLAYLGLAEAGIGAAATIALYKPLADKDQDEVNAVLTSARKYYNKSGYLFLSLVLAMVVVYPYIISQQLDNRLVRSMIVVLGASTLVDFFFIGKYRVLLTADQKSYVVAIIQATGTVVNMVLSIALIYQGESVLIVKSVATLAYMLRFFIVRLYVQKKYPKVSFKVKERVAVIHQRGAALLHQVIGIIINNTDIVMMTLFLGRGSLVEISVYGVYNMVAYAVNMLLTSFSNALTAGFGEVISKDEKETLKRSFSNYEYLYFVILFIVVTCAWVLLLPFVSAYTSQIKDTNYYRPMVAVLFSMIIFLQNVRIPGMTIVCAAGHYKETQGQAILEAVIKIAISIVLIWKWGIVGVLTGTVCSYAYRSAAIMVYNRNHLVPHTGTNTLKRIIRNVLTAVILILGGMRWIPQEMNSLPLWFVYAAGYGIGCVVVITMINFIFEQDEFKALWQRGRHILRKGK